MRSIRVFLGAFGDAGHAFPMIALGSRLAARGHDVTLETWRRWREHVEAAAMRFVPAPEYPVFPTPQNPIGPYEAVVSATPHTRRIVAELEPQVIVHDILTLAPAIAGELEGVPVATLIPHIYPVSGPGLPPYAFGARLPRTAFGQALWRAFDHLVAVGLRQGRAQLHGVRGGVGLPPLERLHRGLSVAACSV